MKLKKIVAGIIATVMVLSMVPVVALTAHAVDYPGDWMTYRSPGDYEEPAPGEEPSYKSAPGFEYTDEGFRTIPADYTNTSPFFTVQTKEKQSVKDGIYLDMRVDDFSYGGENNADHWIAFSIWDSQNIAPGGTKNGSGWICLIRGEGGGTGATLQSFITIADTEEKPGSFWHRGDTALEANVDENGKEHYVLTVEYTEAGYVIKVNGGEAMGGADITSEFDKLDPDGEFYIGVTFHSGQKDGVGSLSILKYGSSESTALVPAGNDRKEPEENVNVIADPADPSTIPVNEPALLFDATGSSYSGEPSVQNLVLTPKGDNSFHIEASATAGFLSWGIRRSMTFMAEDFPVFTLLLKNYWSDGGGVYYCSGDILSAQDNAKTSWSLYDDGCQTYGEDDEYALVVLDLSDYDNWGGRINSMRPDFLVPDPADPEVNNFELMYMGMFRSIEEATAYTEKYLGIEPSATTEDETTTAAPADTTAPETTAEAPADTTAAPAETTAAPADTEAPADTKAPETEAEKKGCGSVIGIGAGAAVLAAAAAAVALKKRR